MKQQVHWSQTPKFRNFIQTATPAGKLLILETFWVSIAEFQITVCKLQPKVRLGTSLDGVISYTLLYHPVVTSGLGVSSLARKDGSGSFGGLRIVSLAWRHHNGLSQSERERYYNSEMVSTNLTLFKSSIDDVHQVLPVTFKVFDPSLLVGTGDTGVSDVFPQLLTFTQDHFHRFCHLIPDCNNFWSELGLGIGETILNKQYQCPSCWRMIILTRRGIILDRRWC